MRNVFAFCLGLLLSVVVVPAWAAAAVGVRGCLTAAAAIDGTDCTVTANAAWVGVNEASRTETAYVMYVPAGMGYSVSNYRYAPAATFSGTANFYRCVSWDGLNCNSYGNWASLNVVAPGPDPAAWEFSTNKMLHVIALCMFAFMGFRQGAPHLT